MITRLRDVNNSAASFLFTTLAVSTTFQAPIPKFNRSLPGMGYPDCSWEHRRSLYLAQTLMSGSRNSSHSRSAQRKRVAREICVPRVKADLQTNRSKRSLRDSRGSARKIPHIGIPVRRNSEGVIQYQRTNIVIWRADLVIPVPAMAIRRLKIASDKRNAIDESSPR